jgi:hypothetical protein
MDSSSAIARPPVLFSYPLFIAAPAWLPAHVQRPMQGRRNDREAFFCEPAIHHANGSRLKFISDNPGEETRMPATRPIERPTMTPEQINLLIEAIEDPHDLCLMCIGLFCATRTSETFGLQ